MFEKLVSGNQDKLYSDSYTGLNKVKRIGIIQSILSYHNGIKLEIHNRKIIGKFQNTWGLNNVLPNNT